MAGAGFKTFTTGEVLLAADVNQYLMQQTVMVFDDASARATAIPTPSEGMFSYLKDTNLTYRYDGSAWLSDAGTTSPLTTKGDIWGYSTTDARIPVGANGTVLTADSAEALGVKWAAASSTPSFLGARASKTANQSLADLTATALTFENEDYDSGGYFTTGSNTRMTIPSGKGGKYLCIAQVSYANSTASASTREAVFRVNGSDTRNESYTNGVNMARPQAAYAVDILDLAAGDYVEVLGRQGSGGNLNVVYDGNNLSYFAITYLGA